MSRKAAPNFALVYAAVVLVLIILLAVVFGVFSLFVALDLPIDNALFIGLIPLLFCFFGIIFAEAMCEGSPAKKKAALFLNILSAVLCVFSLFYLPACYTLLYDIEYEIYRPVYEAFSFLLTVCVLGTVCLTAIGLDASIKLDKNRK